MSSPYTQEPEASFQTAGQRLGLCWEMIPFPFLVILGLPDPLAASQKDTPSLWAGSWQWELNQASSCCLSPFHVGLGTLCQPGASCSDLPSWSCLLPGLGPVFNTLSPVWPVTQDCLFSNSHLKKKIIRYLCKHHLCISCLCLHWNISVNQVTQLGFFKSTLFSFLFLMDKLWMMAQNNISWKNLSCFSLFTRPAF